MLLEEPYSKSLASILDCGTKKQRLPVTLGKVLGRSCLHFVSLLLSRDVREV